MPPRGSEGLDFTPILTHYLFLFTSILAIVGWFVAFIAQAVVTSKFGHDDVGILWFSIFLQLFLILGVFYTLASDSIAMHRLQISVFGAIAVVFAVEGVDKGIFTGDASRGAMAAGWLILAVVDILWVLYFTSEEDSLALHVFNSLGTGGLTPPSRRRRGTRTASVHNMGVGNGYGGAYSSAAGIGPASYDAKLPNSFSPATALRSQNSLHGGSADGGAPRGMGPPGSGPNSPAATASVAALPSSNPNPGVSSPLMSPGNAGVGAGGGPALPDTSGGAEQPLTYPYRAKASFAYTANTEDPNEISFQKGEIMDIMDKNGKWWQARKEDGTIGIVPSNYLQII